MIREIKNQIGRYLSARKGYSSLIRVYRFTYKLKNFFSFITIKDSVSLSADTIKKFNASRATQNFKYICHAPFTNLYFGYEGKIGVCCYNRTHLLGTYPDVSIREAWSNKQAQDIRERIKKSDLSSGCYCCQVQLVEGAYQTVLSRNYDGFKINKKFPTVFEFELSNRCNLQCIMCSEENSSSIAHERFGLPEKLYPYNDDFIEQLREFIPHLQSAKFLGGEPFLIPIYYRIWELFSELNPSCELVIQTNGTVLNDKIKKLLETGRFSLSISIDSLQKDTYELIRKNANFDIVYKNLLYFIDVCKRKNRYIGIATCFIQQNWKEIPDIVRFCNQHQISITFNRVWEPPHCSVWNSSYELTSEIQNYFRTQQFSEKTEIEHRNVSAFNDLINVLDKWNEEEKLKYDKNFDLNNTPIDVLESMIREHIFNSESSKDFSKNEKTEILNKFENAIKVFKTHKEYKTLLLKILETPGEILLRELLNNSELRIEQQIRDILS